MLQLAVSQQPNIRPFAFRSTGVRVYSFEEALYHVYHYWRESMDDLLTEEMVAWVADLGLSYLSARMKELAERERFAEQILGFLRLVPYFNEDEFKQLEENLAAWEARREWEQLKERGDFFLKRGDPSKAIPLYRRALQFEENVPLINNLAVAHMRFGTYGEAMRLLSRARRLEPDNVVLALHYAEAAILGGKFDRAGRALETAEAAIAANPDDSAQLSADVAYLQGLAAFKHSDFAAALTLFETACGLNPDISLYAYKVADTYLAMRQYEQALAALHRVHKPDEEFYTKQAQIYAAYGNLPAAIRAISTAQEKSDSVNLWVRLAAYHRQNYDFERADEAILRALALDDENDHARLENARVKKSLGRTRDYQAILNTILRGFRKRYRRE